MMKVDPPRLRVVLYPDPVLQQKASPVEDPVSEQVHAVAVRMIELMHDAGGIGLAAPQVGLPWRMFVANPAHAPGEDRVFINPVMSDASKDLEWHEEGCLSLPQINGQVRRPKQITITATDLAGETFTLTSDELPARVWQHEYDHLDGVLILDRFTPMDRLANRRLIRDLEADAKASSKLKRLV